MKTCHQCGEKLHVDQERIPARKNQQFVVKYYCSQGHTGRIKGQAGTPETEWAHYGEVWSPRKRVDSPEVKHD